MFRRGFKGFLRFSVAVLDNLIFIPVYLITVLLLRPWRNILPKVYWTLESCLFRELMYTVAYWSWFAGVRIMEFGDNPEDYVKERCLVLVNHQSTADVLTLFTTLSQKFPGGGQLLWIQDVIFKWTHFGVVSQLHGDFFIEQGREKRHLQSQLLRSHLERKYWSRGRNWIMLFPEGGFLYKRLEASQEYAAKHNFPVLNHVTLPRIGAVKAVLDTCRSYKVEDEFDRQVRYLIDVTIIYENKQKPLTLMDFVVGLSDLTNVRIIYKVKPATLMPDNEDSLLKTMYGMWEAKERLMDGYYSKRSLEGYPDKEGRPLIFNRRRFFFQRLIFYSMAYFYYCGLCYLLAGFKSLLFF